MRPADLQAVLAIARESFARPWTASHFLLGTEPGPAEGDWVLRERGKIVGYASVRVVGDEMEIDALAVAVASRRRGFGRRLLEELLRGARRVGCRGAVLEVAESNDAARRLYASFGFEPVGRRRGYYAATGEDALLLRADIDASRGSRP